MKVTPNQIVLKQWIGAAYKDLPWWAWLRFVLVAIKYNVQRPGTRFDDAVQ